MIATLAQVCGPELIRTCHSDSLRQIPEYRQIMSTVGRCDKSPPSPQLKATFAHEALYALIICADALVLKGCPNAPPAISSKLIPIAVIAANSSISLIHCTRS
ncbi:hypothetical protein [Sphingobium baderi]|nr:hypothetical protein [Sphingobium baderi]WRD78947.1 hypothetical protein QQ987_20700 [Sphingobium baderi]